MRLRLDVPLTLGVKVCVTNNNSSFYDWVGILVHICHERSYPSYLIWFNDEHIHEAVRFSEDELATVTSE